MDRPYDAREVLEGLVGKTIHTLNGRPNTVLGIEGDHVRVGTTRSPNGTLVRIQWVQDALDRLGSEGEVEISVEIGWLSQRIHRGRSLHAPGRGLLAVNDARQAARSVADGQLSRCPRSTILALV